MATQRYGTSEAGFTVANDDATGVLRVEAWGFWDPEIAADFGRVAVDACKTRRPARFVLDVTRLKPQREAGQDAFRALLSTVRALSATRTVVVIGENVLIKMQLMRIAREAGGASVTYSASEAAA